MIELEKEFIGTGEVADFKFKQLLASPYTYVYEITAPDCKPHYEVFQRKERPESETVVRGIKIQFTAKVLYPKTIRKATTLEYGHGAPELYQTPWGTFKSSIKKAN